MSNKRVGIITMVKDIYKLWKQIQEAEKSTQIGEKLQKNELGLREQYRKFTQFRSQLMNTQAQSLSRLSDLAHEINVLRQQV